MSTSQQYLAEWPKVARLADGAHYLHGTFGNHPFLNDGHPAWNTRLTFRPNHYVQSSTSPIFIHAAAQDQADGIHTCWGRPMHSAVRNRPLVPRDVLHNRERLEEFVRLKDPRHYRWPRSKNMQPGPDHLVHGESCLGVRHFDCIGFVNWVMNRIFRTTTVRDIISLQRYARDQARVQAQLHPEIAPASGPYQSGDILLFNVGHVGIATGPNRMIEAAGENFGVGENLISQRATDVLRLSSEMLDRIWNVRSVGRIHAPQPHHTIHHHR